MGDLVTGMPETGSGSLAVAIMAVSAALLLLILVFWVIKAGRSKVMFMGTSKSRQPRLAVLETAAIDQRRRLVLIRRDETEHLLLIGGPSDLVVEPAIGARRKELAHVLATEPVPAPPARPPERAQERPPERPQERQVVAPPQVVSAAGPSSDAVDVLEEARARVLAESEPPSERARSATAPTTGASPTPAASADRQFPAERFIAAPDEPDHADRLAKGTAPSQQPAVVAGNPFGDDAFAAVLDAELSKDAAHLDVAPARDARPAAAHAAPTAPRKEASLEEEMARLLSEMAEKRR